MRDRRRQAEILKSQHPIVLTTQSCSSANLCECVPTKTGANQAQMFHVMPMQPQMSQQTVHPNMLMAQNGGANGAPQPNVMTRQGTHSNMVAQQSAHANMLAQQSVYSNMHPNMHSQMVAQQGALVWPPFAPLPHNLQQQHHLQQQHNMQHQQNMQQGSVPHTLSA